MSLFDYLQSISNHSQEDVKDHLHGEENKAEKIDGSEHVIDLLEFIEGIWKLISQHDAEKTEEGIGWVLESVACPEDWHSQESKSNKEGNHIH